MGRARRIWKLTAAAVAVLLVVAAVAVGTLRVWLEHSTTFAPAVVAKLERASGLRLTYTKLDARLGLYGPELVFRDARLYAPGEREPLAAATAGRVGADWWRMLRTGRLAAGRVALDGARVHVLITPKGLELRSQGPLWRGEDGPMQLDRLPVGRLQLTDGTLVVEDRRTGAAPVQLDEVELEIERYSRRLTLDGRARLPRSLGQRLTLQAELDGDLAVPTAVAWRGAASLRDAQLAGWSAFLPDLATLPRAGGGDLALDVRGRGRALERATARLALADVALPPVAGARAVYRRIDGEVRLDRNGAGWRASGRRLQVDAGRAAWRDGEFDLDFESRGGVLQSARLRSPQLRLGALAPFAAVLPAGAARDAWTALAPRGDLAAVDVALARGAAPREWRLDGHARFGALGLNAWGRIPGFDGLDGEFRGAGANGTLALRSTGFELDLPEFLAGRVQARELGATVEWNWKRDGWRFWIDDLRAVAADGRGGGRMRLFLPSDGSSPRLVLDVDVDDLAAAGLPKYLPARRLPASVVAWLDAALLAGRVPHARLTYAGEMRRFPFRDGGGEFRVVAALEDLHLHYQDRWADLQDVHGEVTFLNAGFAARIERARLNGLAATDGTVAMADYRDAELAVRANVRGDVRDALAYVQRAPIGPRLGRWFMGVAGRGALDAKVALDLPLKSFADRVVAIDARVDRASLRLPGVDDDARIATASFRLLNRDVEVQRATGTLLGGPFEARASTVDGARGERVLTVTAQGRAQGSRVQPLIGITSGAWLDGAFDWTASARLPRLEWRPDPLPLPRDAPPDARPASREPEVRWLPMTARAESTLVGLAVRLPAPLAKPADEARAFRAEFAIDPGVDAGALPPPRALRAAESERPTTLQVRAQAGRDAALLAWRRDAAWTFERGTARFGGGASPALREARGLWVEGRVPEFDLSAWLRVKLTAPPPAGAPASADPAAPTGIAALLRGGTLHADRFSIFGYSFADEQLQVENRDRAWRARVDGPAARGTIVVPFDLQRGGPLVLEMDRLTLGERGARADPDAAAEPPTDPRELPAMRLVVRSLEIQKRRFGSLEADLARTPDGLRLERGTLRGASFEASGQGTWSAGPQGIATRVTLEATSTDLLDTLSAFGFAPSISAASALASATLTWPGGFDDDVLSRLNGTARLSLQDGQLLNVQPGAGRMLGLMSVSALPRRLALDFTDITDRGFAYDTITGDFEFRNGNAHTQNLLLKSPAADIGIVGRTGLGARDYDQTAVVTGHFDGTMAAAGALAAGPAIGAAVLLFSKLFQQPLANIARGYYRITGSWEKPKVERVGTGRRGDAPEPEKVGDARTGGGTP
jgi:uncharacterized protein YhdP